MAESVMIQLAWIIGIATVLALVGKFIKQPTIIAYLVTGIVIGPLFLGVLEDPDLIKVLAHLGVTFLLFLIGLSMDFRILREIRKVAFAVGLGQVMITSFAGFLIALWLGFSYVPALFLAAALAFSSTVIVMKMLSDKRELDTLHGKIIVGIVVVQNIIAALVLLLVPVIGAGEVAVMGAQLAKGLFLILVVFLFSHLIIPGVLSLAAKSQEILFLFSIGWAFTIAIIFYISGFSVEVGALVAGMSLASSRFSLEISSKIKGLREFFVMIHLIFFGSLLVGPISYELIFAASIFSAFILVGNPIIVMSIMKAMGYKKQTGFLTGISIAQISEFSLIIVFLSYTLDILPRETLSLVVLVALITIGVSSYGVHYSNRLYRFFSPLLGVFDGKGHNKGNIRFDKHDIVLFGYNRIGFNLLKAFKKMNKKHVIVDYNPKTISDLSSRGIKCIYGDADDFELVKSLKLDSSEVVISTIPDLETNLELLKSIRNRKVIFIPTSHSISDTKKLYSAGADYVIMPHFLGGDYVAHILMRENFSKGLLEKEKEKQVRELAERIVEGHEHPNKDEHGK
jgi:Kef-type K+ transport system membrane component KefB